MNPHKPGEIRLAKLDWPEEEYVLQKWLVELGSRVGKQQCIAIVETKSFTMEICVFDEGVVAEMNAIVGKAIPDGALIARIAVDQ